MSVIHDFVVFGRPRTPQTKNAGSRADWKRKVGVAAGMDWPEGRPALDREVALAVVYFYVEETDLDVDGIAKLVMDALEGSIIVNDRFVSQATLRKTELSHLAYLEEPPPSLAQAVNTNREFVYVSISDGPDHRRLP